MQNDGGVRQRGPLTFGPCRKNYCRRAHGLADADGVHRRLHIAEGVADGEGFGLESDRITRVPAGASGVDIEVNRLLWVVELQIKQLSNDQLSHVDAHLTLGVVVREQGQAQVDDSLLEQE